MKIGVLLYTYNRTDDARINMEIIRDVWKENPLLKDVVIVHSYNGKEEWWPEKYLEDTLLRLDNPGHFSGAELLINSGMETFLEKYPEVDYVLILASDTWCVKPDYIASIVNGMSSQKKYLATSAWGSKKDTNMFKIGMSLDFSMMDMNFIRASRMFPLRYMEFVEKYEELLSYQGTQTYLERVFAVRFKQAVSRVESVPSENLVEKIAQAHIYHLIEREPIHYDLKRFLQKTIGVRVMYWPKLGLITHHDPVEKQKVLRPYQLLLGEYGKRFLDAASLDYFNNGLTKTAYKKNGKAIGYND